jgi:O-antigen ligase
VTLLVCALLLVGLLTERRTRGRLLVLVPGLALAGIGVALSLSRGSWLGAAAALVLIALLLPGSLRVIAPIGVVALLLATVGPLSSDLAVAEQRLDTSRTVDERLATNDAAFQMIADRPLLGFGYGNFERFDESFKSAAAGLALRRQVSAHHSYLALAAENGVPALALYLAPAAALLARSVRRWRSLPRQHVDRRWLVLLWACALDQFVVSNFMDMLHSSAWGTALWWLTLGMIMLVLERPATQTVGMRTPQPPSGVRMAWHPAR